MSMNQLLVHCSCGGRLKVSYDPSNNTSFVQGYLSEWKAEHAGHITVTVGEALLKDRSIPEYLSPVAYQLCDCEHGVQAHGGETVFDVDGSRCPPSKKHVCGSPRTCSTCAVCAGWKVTRNLWANASLGWRGTVV